MIPLLKGARRLIFASVVASALGQAVAAAAGAWCVQHLFDELAGGSDAGDYDLRLLAGGFAAAALLAFLLEVLQRRLGEGLALNYTAEVRLALFDHHLNSPAGHLGGRSHGAALLPFVGDLAALKQWVSSGLARVSAALVTTIALLMILASRNLILTASVATAIALGAAILLALGSPLDAAVREVRRRRGALAGFVSSRLSAVAAIQMMARTKTERRKVIARMNFLNKAGQRRAWLVGGMRGAAQLTGSLLILATLLAGMHEIAARRLTPGEVVGALSLVGLLAAGMHDFARGLEMWYPARISRQRILASLRQAAHCPPFEGDVQRSSSAELVLHSLSVGSLLSNLSASACAGEVVLIEGKAGAGKSALLGCIAQTSEPEAGAILYRGKDMRSLSPGALNRTVGFASPAIPLLKGSLGMNLRYRKPKASVDEINHLVSSCGLERLVSGLPKGLDNRLIEGGANLSLGERQSLLLARALLGSPPVLLIDSVDSHLDPAVIEWLADTLRSYRGVVLMTAIRPELLNCATRTWCLCEGTLADQPHIAKAASTSSLPNVRPPQDFARSRA